MENEGISCSYHSQFSILHSPFAPVEYREYCELIQGVWTVTGLCSALPSGAMRACTMREPWPERDSPQSQPDRLGWFRERLFAWYERQG